MIQFNLLPDVKIEYIKTTRIKRSVMMAATVASGAAIFIMITLFLLINVAQKKHLNDLSADIKTNSKKLQSIKDISKILTVQNQLVSLDSVHDKKPVTSRLSKYIEIVTPANISLANLEVKFAENSMEISGQGAQLADINKFVDTIKFTKYTAKEDNKENNANEDNEPLEEKLAFSKVVLSSFEKTEKGITYTINLAFDPTIFDAKWIVTLNVPTITTNRSATEKPAALFQETPLPKDREQ